MDAETGSSSATAVRWAWWDYVSVLSSQGIFALWTVLGVILSARILGPEGYGTVALFMSVIQLLFIVGVKWSFPAVVRFGREALIREGAGGRVFWAWMPLFAGSLLLCSLILVLLSREVGHLVGLQDSHSQLFIFFLSLTAMAMAAVQLLQMKGKMRVAAWVTVVGRAIFVGLLAAFALWSSWRITPKAVILLSALGLAAQVLISLLYMGTRVVCPFRTGWGLTRNMARYSLPLVLAFIGAYVSDWADLYFLRLFRDHAEVGVYQVSYQALLFVTGVLIGINTLAFPLLTAWRAEGREDRVVRYVVCLIPKVGVLWGLLVLGIGIVQEPIFLAVFGPKFVGSEYFFSVLLIGAAFQSITSLYSPLFLTHDIPGQGTSIVLLMAGVNVMGNFLLVPTFGAVGAAFSTSGSFAVSAWLHLRWGNRRIGVDRFVAFVPPSLVALALLAARGRGLGIRAAIFLGASVALIEWARRWRIFSMEDLSFIEQLPSPVGAMATKFYRFLSS